MSKQGSTTTRREFVKRVGAAAAGATLFLGQNTLSAYAESVQEVRPSHPSEARNPLRLNALVRHQDHPPGKRFHPGTWSPHLIA